MKISILTAPIININGMDARPNLHLILDPRGKLEVAGPDSLREKRKILGCQLRDRTAGFIDRR